MGKRGNTIAMKTDPVGRPLETKYHPSAGEVAIVNYAGERTIVAAMRYNATGELEVEIEDEEGEKIILWAGTIATGDDGKIDIKAARMNWARDVWVDAAAALDVIDEIENDSAGETPAGRQARSWITEPIDHATKVAAFEQAERWAREHDRAYVVLRIGDRYTVEASRPGRFTDTETPIAIFNPPRPGFRAAPEADITDAEARDLAEILSAEILKRPVTVGTQRADVASAPDPLAAFRHLPTGAPLYDRASGRLIGHLERVAGDTVQLRSVITGHSVYSSGLALTPESATT